jgi:hypothetical protein
MHTPERLLRMGGGFAASLLFRPLSRRWGCVAAEPYPPPRRVDYINLAVQQFCSERPLRLDLSVSSLWNAFHLPVCPPFRLPLVGRGAGRTHQL